MDCFEISIRSSANKFSFHGRREINAVLIFVRAYRDTSREAVLFVVSRYFHLQFFFFLRKFRKEKSWENKKETRVSSEVGAYVHT